MTIKRYADGGRRYCFWRASNICQLRDATAYRAENVAADLFHQTERTASLWSARPADEAAIQSILTVLINCRLLGSLVIAKYV